MPIPGLVLDTDRLDAANLGDAGFSGYGDFVASPIPGLYLSPEIAFATGAGDVGYLVLDDPSRGKLDTAKLAGADYFTGVGPWLRGGSVRRGASRADGVYGRAEAGTMELFLANEDRRFDPTNLSGPYVAAGRTQVRAGRAIRLRAMYADVAYDLFRGFIEEPRLTYRNKGFAQVTMVAVDGTAAVANFDQNAGGIVGTGETTGARINRVLDNLGWPAEERNIAAGKTTVQGTDLSANAWAEIVLASDTELGETYFDVDGKLTFRDRHALARDARSATSQATFGDANDGVELGYVDVELSADLAQTRNIIRASRVGGTQQVKEDSASIAEYRRRTMQRSDLIHQTDSEVADWASLVLDLLKTSELRFSSITVDPLADPARLFPQALGRKLGDRITVLFTPPGGGARIARDAFIRGIDHQVGLATWRTRWALQDAAAVSSAFFVLDSSSMGVLDSDSLAY